MLRYISMLIVVALCASAARAADWGTDADSVIVIHPSDGTPDTRGECDVYFDGTYAVDSTADSTVVQAAYNLGAIGQNGNALVLSGDTAWFPYRMANHGNVTDQISIQVTVDSQNITGGIGNVLVVADRNGDSIFNGGDSLLGSAGSDTLSLAEDGSQAVLIGVPIPAIANNLEYAGIKVTVKGHQATGIDDLWPKSYPYYLAKVGPDNGDLLQDTLLIRVGRAKIFFATAVNKISTVPGDTMQYTLVYDNDGLLPTQTAATGGVGLRQVLPQFVVYTSNSLNYTQLHAGTATIQFSKTTAPGIFNQTEAWGNANPDSVGGFQTILHTDVAADDNSEGTDIVGKADGDVPDVDAGKITYRVIVR